MKKNIGSTLALYPTPVTVIGAMDGEKPTWTLVAHIGIIGHDRVLVSLAAPHHINHLIKEGNKLSVNIVDEKMLPKADYVGSVSGETVDKSEVFDFELGEQGTPIIKEAPLAIECKVEDIYNTQNFESFICSISGTYVEEEHLNKDGKVNYNTLKPVLFEFPSYEYLRTGEIIGNCLSLKEEYKASKKNDDKERETMIMPKGSVELTNARKEEIVNACEQLYKTIGFKEITLKEIGKVTSFTRTSIYNYFQTKEEIFLEILKKEYVLWIAELQQIMDENDKLSKQKFAEKIAASLEHREQLLKILSMNMYDMEENSRMENLVEFKKIYGKSMQTMLLCIGKFFNNTNIVAKQTFIYQFFPFVYGIYPYTEVTKKQKEAMKEAGIDYSYQSIYEITYNCLIQLLTALEE